MAGRFISFLNDIDTFKYTDYAETDVNFRNATDVHRYGGTYVIKRPNYEKEAQEFIDELTNDQPADSNKQSNDYYESETHVNVNSNDHDNNEYESYHHDTDNNGSYYDTY